MARFGLLGKTVLVLIAVFGALAAVLHLLYLPYLENRIRRNLAEVSEEVLENTEEVMRARAEYLEEKNLRQLGDLPYELTAGDPAKTSAMVTTRARGLGRAYHRNVTLFLREFHARMAARTDARGRALGEQFRSDAVSGLLILLGSLFLLLGTGLAFTVLLPLGRLLRATERVTGGRLDARVGLSGRDEVGRLGRAFDEMTSALASSRGEVDALNRTLADKVEEQTLALRERNAELGEANEQLRGTIAELKAAKDALVHSKTMASIGTLAGGVAHEFNNLLGGIMGCADDLWEEEDAGEVREGLDMILRTGRRACNITENLLRFSRPSDRTPRETDLSALVGEAVKLVGPEAQKRGIRLDAHLGEIPEVTVDPGQIHQVVLNLLTNAIHASRSGGRIEVRTGADGDETVIEVTDEGVGIEEAHRDRIFEPFFTTRDAATRETGGGERGTGLGLSVSYTIVKDHGGTIEVESRPGEGSTFRVRLPGSGGEDR